MQTIPTATPPQPRARRRSMWLLAMGLAVTVLVTLGVGIVVFRGNDSSSTNSAVSQHLASAQLTSVQQACQQWSGSSAPSLGQGSPSSWCSTMTDWMGQQLRNGRTTGAMMWGSATTLQATCQQWMVAGSGSTSGGTASPAWCGQMADWMVQHVGNWNSWMMSGNMMGR